MNSYLTIKKKGESLYKVKGSKHLGYAFHVKTEEEIKAKLDQLREEHSKANHVCYAWRLGIEKDRERANDDGEPSNSAGKPILGSIDRYDLTNALVAVVRYFGGTKLGVGGLIDAYKTASDMAIQEAGTVEKFLFTHTELRFGYDAMSDVMRIIRQHKLEVVERELKASCRLVITTVPEMSEEILTNFNGIPDIRLRNMGTY
jgi:uncharacterized YigZ family protein